MADPRDYRDLIRRLHEERANLQRARENYEIIMQSRFHAVRMLWFSFKQLIGRTSPSDAYAAWGPASRVHLPGLKRTADQAETALVESWNRRIAATKLAEPPLATVVIPVYNHRETTANCLNGILEAWPVASTQFVVVDDGSRDDDVASLVGRLHGVDFLRRAHNSGFVDASNLGASLARGKYILFLNNDTIVRNGWLDELVATLESDASIGIVGSKLVYPNGRLQEAGAIIWRDATGWNVGRNGDPNDPRYNFPRDVDYVSGAALMIRRDLFEEVGGLSTYLRPAYYEDTDLCFKVQAAGSRVVYQPKSTVVHYEGVTSGRSERSGTKRHQEINRPKFRATWANRLDGHFENNPANVPAASLSHERGRNVLVIDSFVPMHDKEAGAQRIFHIVKLLRDAGYSVTFLPDNFAPLEPYTAQLQALGVQVLHHVEGGQTLTEALEWVLPAIDIAWISRPELFEHYAPTVRKNGGIRLIYDTVDLHFVRKQREAAVNGDGTNAWQEIRRTEIANAKAADATVVVTPEEQDVLQGLGVSNVFVLPTIHEPTTLPRRRFEDTDGLLFIGNYNHPPNVDAVQWLVNEVMPLVWETLPEVHLTLVGSNPNDAVRALKSERVRVTGYVANVTPYFRSSRVFVAPLRYGAGMKGKIGQALEFALPIITTPVGVEGFGLKNDENVVIAELEPQKFAAAIVDLYGDRDRWKCLSDNAVHALQGFTPDAVSPELEAILTTRFREKRLSAH